ncbi:DEAD/DEAH box helicase [Alkalicoccus daliensis]|uniref:Competence protein ComFA n=1 Tax=Alkalicoccus daliensis TaxID=745820 RepID=A0A1H0J2K7_9BACI|nr:helicase-related protein [Alkalicoccus daliensis]SDO37591.1 competence protein ComFA [Alkalicoccus daliensis]
MLENQILTMLQYRRLLLDELVTAVPEQETGRYMQVKKVLAVLEAAGEVKSMPALTTQPLQCERCGNNEHFGLVKKCGRCGKACSYCRNCFVMGRMMSCSRLYMLAGGPRRKPAKTAAGMHWEGELSARQSGAAKQLVAAYKEGKDKEMLLWAVCGAGKTEMLFPLIAQVLLDEKPVMIATPRRDVVQELEPRLRKAFPKAAVAGFYGGKGAEEKFQYADIAVATTHQLLRFRDAFEVLIIDEVDAFPYTVDEKLKYAAKKAQKEKGFTVLVTATPSLKQQKLVKHKQLPAAVVARRYHNFDLPLPRMIWCGNWKKRLQQGYLPAALKQFLRRHAKKQILLFVPEITQLEEVKQALLSWEADFRVDTVHSAEEERSERVQAFREKKVDVLVTTTILERGITIENVQVGVLGAEAPIFTNTALIQIAGRAGRSSRYPDGEVAFFHYGKTTEMNRAVRTIRTLNREGR